MPHGHPPRCSQRRRWLFSHVPTDCLLRTTYLRPLAPHLHYIFFPFEEGPNHHGGLCPPVFLHGVLSRRTDGHSCTKPIRPRAKFCKCKLRKPSLLVNYLHYVLASCLRPVLVRASNRLRREPRYLQRNPKSVWHCSRRWRWRRQGNRRRDLGCITEAQETRTHLLVVEADQLPQPKTSICKFRHTKMYVAFAPTSDFFHFAHFPQ